MPYRHLLVVLLLACVVTSAHAAECKLVRATSIDLADTEPEAVTFDITIQGKPYPFALNLESFVSMMGSDAAAKFTNARMPVHNLSLGDTRMTRAAVLPEIQLGGLTGHDEAFMLIPDNWLSGHDHGVIGEVGLDKLQGYDVELDLAHDKLNLFQKDHCKGQVIYWTGTAAIVPFEMQLDGQIMIPTELDGVPIKVNLDTTRLTSQMTFATAHRLLGVRHADLELISGADDHHPDKYRYHFKTLAVGGLTINNPEIVISDYGAAETICDGHLHSDVYGPYHSARTYRCSGTADMQIGLKQLRQLRLFIAFSEKTLYITPADAH